VNIDRGQYSRFGLAALFSWLIDNYLEFTSQPFREVEILSGGQFLKREIRILFILEREVKIRSDEFLSIKRDILL